MDAAAAWPWVGLLLLGAGHGINPAMGWLFAVALGLQEQRRRAVWRALAPLALGHALAIAVAVALAAALGAVLPIRSIQWIVAAALLSLGIFRLVRHRHLRWGGMRVGQRDLAVWSFLVASAHGAGLMALPLVLEVERQGGHGAMLHAGMAPSVRAAGERGARLRVPGGDRRPRPRGLRVAGTPAAADRLDQPRSDLGRRTDRVRRADAAALTPVSRCRPAPRSRQSTSPGRSRRRP